MGMQLNILARRIKPPNYIPYFILVFMSTANINEENVLDAALVTYRTHLADSGRSKGVFSPDQSLDVLIRSTFGQSFRIDGEHHITLFITHHLWFNLSTSSHSFCSTNPADKGTAKASR